MGSLKACSGSRGVAVTVVAAVALAFAPTATHPQGHFEGEIGPCSSYEIDVPTNWDGVLVVYAHAWCTPTCQ